jgi:hypothetical protein
LAQKAFGLAEFLRLVTAEGHVLNDPEKSLEAAGLSEGDHLTAIAQQGKLAATKEAFAFWSPGSNRILTWGHPKVTGRCAVQDKLGPVRMFGALDFWVGFRILISMMRVAHSRPSWKTAPLSRGETWGAVVSAPKSKISS